MRHTKNKEWGFEENYAYNCGLEDGLIIAMKHLEISAQLDIENHGRVEKYTISSDTAMSFYNKLKKT